MLLVSLITASILGFFSWAWTTYHTTQERVLKLELLHATEIKRDEEDIKQLQNLHQPWSPHFVGKPPRDGGIERQ